MNLNTICLRIFYVLFILTLGGIIVYFRGTQLVAPLAIRFLETETTDARMTNTSLLVIPQPDDTQKFFTGISYAGHTTNLVTTAAPVGLEEAARRELQDEKATLKSIKAEAAATWDKPPEPERIVTFKVRYVKAFPWMVVREVPGASIWQLYGDIWSPADWNLVAIAMGVMILMIVLLWKNVRKGRRDAYGWRR